MLCTIKIIKGYVLFVIASQIHLKVTKIFMNLSYMKLCEYGPRGALLVEAGNWNVIHCPKAKHVLERTNRESRVIVRLSKNAIFLKDKSPCGQFHRHFMSEFAPISLCRKSSNLKYKYKKLHVKLSFKKAARKCWRFWHMMSISPTSYETYTSSFFVLAMKFSTFLGERILTV